MNNHSFTLIHDPANASHLMGLDWYREACRLELNDRLKDMEVFVRQVVQAQEYALVIASVYRHRMLRLQKARDLTGATAAWSQAFNWANYYPAMASSGGEGTDMARQRDAFLQTLGRDAPDASG